MKNADLPAMPLSRLIDTQGDTDYETGGGRYISANGLTKREMIVIHAMQGILANSASDEIGYTGWETLLTENSVKAADALLAELEK